MNTASDVIHIYQLFGRSHIPLWLTGGWGIDALLGEQTRPHKDLDVLVLLEDVTRLRVILENRGFTLKELWSENRWETDLQGNEIATAFVLQDGRGRKFDAHALRLDEHGNGIPAWDNPEGLIFTQADLSGRGMIAGFAVRCITPQSQVLCHQGYELPEKHRQDLNLLRAKFGGA